MDLLGLILVILGVIWLLNGAVFGGILVIVIGVLLGGAGVNNRRL